MPPQQLPNSQKSRKAVRETKQRSENGVVNHLETSRHFAHLIFLHSKFINKKLLIVLSPRSLMAERSAVEQSLADEAHGSG